MTTSDHFSKSSRDISQQIGVGERTLTRLFVTLTGMTFGEYKKRIQMEYAITLLQSGLPVTEVALQVGYETPSGFIYAFRHYTGRAPGQYKVRAPA
ncbi:helix-turn-helix domain-containing protein [Erwinia sp. V71]|uniref:helix-turn-helix domain-containing protein n=1 Tax=Erwinia sp. V71 TaxID=3369424 RepID=UPI003F5DBA2F